MYHPDKHSHELIEIRKDYEEKFKKINSAHEFLTSSPDKSPIDEMFSNVFEAPTKEEYLNAFSELFKQANLDISNLKVFNTMTEEEIEMVGHNIGYLFEHDCLNQQSFNIACEHLDWPDKSEFSITNPYVSKYIFESMMTKNNFKINSECGLGCYGSLIKAFKRLSGDENGGDRGWIPPYPNLVTQERLNQLIEHPDSAENIARILTRLAHVGLLTPEIEEFSLGYLSRMGRSMFLTLDYYLLGKNEASTLKILQEAQNILMWDIERESQLDKRVIDNQARIAGNKSSLLQQYEDNHEIDEATKIESFDRFKQEHYYWSKNDKLFTIMNSFLSSNLITMEQLNSCNHLLLHFITTDKSVNLKDSLCTGLVTFEELNRICEWSEKVKRISNDDYLICLLSEDGVNLMQSGVFSPSDIYAFPSPNELRGYIEKQAEQLRLKTEVQNVNTPKPPRQDFSEAQAIKYKPQADLANSRVSSQHDDSSLAKTISKQDFEKILNTYKSQSLLGYLSTFWLLSWISPIRSQTMHELRSLLSSVHNEDISQVEIEGAISRGDNNAHRTELFKGRLSAIKNTTGRDEVIVQLKEALNKPSHGT